MTGSPLYRQVYSVLRGHILRGELRPGEKLPPTRTLAETLSVSRATVAEAYEQLRAEGYVRGRTGSGTFVADSIPAGDRLQSPPDHQMPPALSSWGRRVASMEVSDPVDPANAPRFDLRPHSVASDVFPWDAWTASVNAALKEDRFNLERYPPSAGLPELRAAIARHLQQFRAVRCTPEQIIVVNGAQQGLNLLAEMLMEPGDIAVVEDPGYPQARLALECRGLTVHRVPVDGEGLVLREVERLPQPRLIHVTPSHQDPTGVTMSLSRRLALLDLAVRGDTVVVEDDYDSEFRYEGRPIEALQSLDRHGRTVYIGSFSKSVLPGLRIGFLAVPDSLAPALLRAKAAWDGGAPALDQAALARFLRSGDYERHIRRMRRVYRSRRDALAHALTAVFGSDVAVPNHRGGLNMLVTLVSSAAAGGVIERAARDGVALRPLDDYFRVMPDRLTFLLGFGALVPEDALPAVKGLSAAVHGVA